ncbi:MAG: uracil-xanthine permease [Ruminococcaceae bacterium]|nr:uracil-xanthine permease [Oscillospiraceae bacterium]
MKLIYNVNDKPKFPQLIVYALQQLLAIMTATLVVPVIVGNGMDPAAALLGAGIGTLVYVLFTKKKSPVFLGSSFAFLGSMAAAFAGGVSMQLGYLGLILGAVFAGLVYVVIAIIVKIAGVNWISKLMPAVVIGPIVALIGLSLAGNAVGDLQKAPAGGHPYVAIICGLVTLAVIILCSTYGKKTAKLIPFIIGILAGYAVASIFTIIGNVADIDALKVVDYSPFTALVEEGVTWKTFLHVPGVTFWTAFKGIGEITPTYIGTIAVAYIPVAFVVFAEHIADHKNISSIIEKDLLEEPGLHRTLLGDGIGSIAGAFFGGCPNTTYGESVGCVAITRNASVATIITAAIEAIIVSFLAPLVAFVNSIPSCVMGGVCMALYGFIAVSGLKMIQNVDLGKNRNLFVVSVILISGIGGLSLTFGKVTLTTIAVALILGILTNLMVSKKTSEDGEVENQIIK